MLGRQEVSAHNLDRVYEMLTVFSLESGLHCVPARKSLIPNPSLHLSGAASAVVLESRMLVAGSMSSIMMVPMHLVSVRALAGEMVFFSRIDSAMLATVW